MLVAACAVPQAPDDAALLVIARQDDGDYALQSRELPSLHDPVRLEGELGIGYRGGVVRQDRYLVGDPLRIDFEQDGDTLVPVDESGLVLWSFYAHLSDVHDQLVGLGYDLDPIFPVRIAYTPASVLDYLAVENAAFVLGLKTFIVFPDALDGVPLAANAGVVRHEFGHAWFELLVTGTSGGAIPWIEGEDLQQVYSVNALGEGFADMVATLTLDDPTFFDASLTVPSRDVRQDVTSAGKYPPEDANPLTYDPYALGTVYAAFIWDVREATSPETALDLAVRALAAWGEEEAWADPDRFVELAVSLADGEALAAACASAYVRFDLEPPEC